MKRMNLKNRIRTLAGFLFLFVMGCGREETVFVDVGLEEGMTVSESTMEETQDSDAEEMFYLPEEEPAEMIKVHVCGAVWNPGVYELSSAERVIDAVNMAGGMTEDADDAYMNLAGRISDAEQIYIPTREEAETLQENVEQRQGADAGGKVNINTADITLLCTLPGIGQTRAQSIIDYRQNFGIFRSIEDIMQVSGIKENSFQKLKEYITVN